MKKILTVFAFASVFVACKNQSSLDKTKDVVLVSDTLGAYKSNYSTDTASTHQANALINGDKTTGVVGATGNGTRTPTPRYNTRSSSRSRSNTNRTSSNRNTGNGTMGSNGNNGSSGTARTTRKKGWSKAAQGTVIGGVGGAVAGAVISKNKGKGAVIGGVVGAAGGYIIGRGKDKKDGRVR